jgi:hypothetical protein
VARCGDHIATVPPSTLLRWRLSRFSEIGHIGLGHAGDGVRSS